MALAQKGANYRHREHLKDQYVKGALDDVASQIQAIRTQGNFGATGVPDAPTAPVAVNVVNQGGLYTVTILHNNPPVGTRWRLEYSTSPQFTNAIPIDLGEAQFFQSFLPSQRLYFRAAAKFLASDLSPFVYYSNSGIPLSA